MFIKSNEIKQSACKLSHMKYFTKMAIKRPVAQTHTAQCSISFHMNTFRNCQYNWRLQSATKI